MGEIPGRARDEGWECMFTTGVKRFPSGLEAGFSGRGRREVSNIRAGAGFSGRGWVKAGAEASAFFICVGNLLYLWEIE